MKYWIFVVSCVVAVGCKKPTLFLDTAACETAVVSRTLDEPTSLGVTGRDALTAAELQFADVGVTWVMGPAPEVSDTLSFAFGSPQGVEEASQQASDVCTAARTWIEVAVPATLTSGSGDLEASGTVLIRGLADGSVYLKAPEPLDATLGGVYAAEAAQHPGTLDRAAVGLDPSPWGIGEEGEQVHGIVVAGFYTDAEAGGSSAASLFRCGTRETGNDCWDF